MHEHGMSMVGWNVVMLKLVALLKYEYFVRILFIVFYEVYMLMDPVFIFVI